MPKSLTTALRLLLFPDLCPFCGKVIPPQTGCCRECRAKLPRTSETLEPVPGTEALFCPLYYEKEAANAIRELKFAAKPGIARHLARLMAEVVPAEGFDCIVPIPMHRSGIRKRGYNQAGLLARFLSEETGIPFREFLRKTRKTPPQHTLSAEERAVNLKGALSPARNAKPAGLRILLVDDVVTTGSTVAAAAEILRENGASSVCAAAAARTRPKEEQST